MSLTRLLLAALCLMTFVALPVRAAEEVQEIEDMREEPDAPRPDLEATRAQLVEKSNAYRKAQERGMLVRNQTLDKTAQAFADYMAQTLRYGHTADGNQPHERAEAQGYQYAMISEKHRVLLRFQRLP